MAHGSKEAMKEAAARMMSMLGDISIDDIQAVTIVTKPKGKEKPMEEMEEVKETEEVEDDPKDKLKKLFKKNEVEEEEEEEGED